jgi:hypothetical protein
VCAHTKKTGTGQSEGPEPRTGTPARMYAQLRYPKRSLASSTQHEQQPSYGRPARDEQRQQCTHRHQRSYGEATGVGQYLALWDRLANNAVRPRLRGGIAVGRCSSGSSGGSPAGMASPLGVMRSSSGRL